MSVLTAIADEFPLLAAVAHELGDDNGNEVARLRVARRLLGDVLNSLDPTPAIFGGGSLNKRRRRRRWGPRRREVINDARRKAKAPAVQG